MKRNLVILAAIILGVAGCDKSDLRTQNEELTRELAAKDQFINDVTSSINEIHNTLEQTWDLEKNIVRQAGTSEGSESMTPVELKAKIINRISDVRSLLQENKQKIATLERKLRSNNHQYAGLEKLVSDLKEKLDERERSIGQLNAQILDLQNDVHQKAEIIAAHEVTIAANENTIDQQTKQLNTVYYTVGTKNDLKEKGVVQNDGGILWGLMGTTTILNPNFDNTLFTPVDMTKESTFEIDGAVKEIVPRRDESSYSIEKDGRGNSVLVIFHPKEFWREKHLAVIVK